MATNIQPIAKRRFQSVITPFTSSPDPTGVFLTSAFQSAVYKTTHMISRRQGLSCILGDPGHGKSTLMRYLYSRYLADSGCACSFTPNPNFKSDFALLRKIGLDLGVPAQRSMLSQQSVFEDWIADQYIAGVNIIIFIDEAQRLDGSQLELIRTILNFESDTQKATQIIMAGNFELRDKLMQRRNKSILSRVFAPCLMSAMSRDDMVGMLKVRCDRGSIKWPFSGDALDLVYAWSSGTPRAILQACEFAYAQAAPEDLQVTGPIMARVLETLEFHPATEEWPEEPKRRRK